MKKLLILILTLCPTLFAVQRVVVMEDFTATWCTYCPGAARGAEELKFRAFDSVVVIAYHPSTSDPFYTATAASRMSYYGVSGYPTMRIDGTQSVVGGMHYGTMYPTYRQIFDYRKTVTSSLEIDLDVVYDSVTRNGTLTILIRNTSTAPVSGQLHTVITESHIYYPWQGMDSLHDVERTMLPSAAGEAVTIPANDTIIRTRNFTIASGWVAKNCEIIVFVQDNATKIMYQGAMTAVTPEPLLKYSGCQPVLPAPGSTITFTPALRNIGTAAATGASAVLSTTDPYLSITQNTTSFGSIPIGADVFASQPFVIQISSSCPDPHLALLKMIVTSTDFGTDTIQFALNITASPGFADDMEHGIGNWTHGGIRDYWHLSTYRSISPSNSWYCGNEAGHQYINEMDARLMTPMFTVGESAWVRFWHYYQTEENYDFALVELNNGSPFWYQLASFTGSIGNWEQVQLDLTPFRGQTVQLRFRFISDYSEVGEGWYIDDLTAGTGLAFAEPALQTESEAHSSATIIRSRLNLTGTISGYDPSQLLDATGRKKYELTPGSNDLSHLAPGVYFIKTADQPPRRIILLR